MLAPFNLTHEWTWAVYPTSQVPFVRMLLHGFELRIQAWPHRPYDNVRWDLKDGEHSVAAFGYCDTVEDAEHLAIEVAALCRARLPRAPELTEFIEL